MSEDAEVMAFGFNWDEIRFFADGLREVLIHAETDEKGLFELTGLGERKQRVTAIHPDFAEGFNEGMPGEPGAIEIRLEKGFCVFGKVLGKSGEPLEGVLIHLSGHDIPFGRFVRSGKDGAYRTAPALPGLVTVTAGEDSTLVGMTEEIEKSFAEKIEEAGGRPTPEILKELEKYRFEKETKAAEIKDRDVEVNFGVAGEYATWKGTLYGPDGSPVAGGTLILKGDYSYPWKETQGGGGLRFVVTGAAGRFEVEKLVPGRYEVEISFREGNESREVAWEKITFSEPGLMERDIHLTEEGSEISGQVVYGWSGEPVLGKTGTVAADWVDSRIYKEFTAPFDLNGRFRFTNLPAGQYRLSVERETRRIPSTRDPVRFVQVGKNEKVAGVEVPFIEEGRLKLEIKGFDDPGHDRINVRYCLAEGFRIYSHTGLLLDDDGSLEETIGLETGKYLAIISHPGSRGVGQYDALFELVDDRETVISIGSGDFIYSKSNMTLSGRLTDADGSPVAGATIELSADSSNAPYLEEGEAESINPKGVSDESGRFFMQGLRPGIWEPKVIHSGGMATIFPNIYLPVDTLNHRPLNLVLPSGTVTGVFCDSRTGLLLDHAGPKWNVFLYGRGGAGSARASGQGGDRFEMTGICSGTYVLVADVVGYLRYVSRAFQVNEGQDVDFGEVKLTPCGVLDLELLDGSGNPIEEFELFCNDEEIGSQHRSEKLGPGRFRFDKLPVGPAEIKVKAEGFEIRTLKVTLEPSLPVEIRLQFE